MSNINFYKKFTNYSVRINEKEFIEVIIDEGAEITKDEVIEGTDYILSKVGSNKYPALFIAKEFSLPTKETMQYLASKDSLSYSLADAYVICSFPQKLVANFYLRVNKPARPTKFFNKVEEAENWLIEMKKIKRD